MPLLGIWDQTSRSKSCRSLAGLLGAVVFLVKALPTLHHGTDYPSSRGFALSEVHFMGVDEFMTCVHCYSITQSSLTIPKVPCAPPFPPCSLQNPGNH